jgi:hypothetical protein
LIRRDPLETDGTLPLFTSLEIYKHIFSSKRAQEQQKNLLWLFLLQQAHFPPLEKYGLQRLTNWGSGSGSISCDQNLINGRWPTYKGYSAKPREKMGGK